MPPRVRALLAPLFVVLTCALSLSVTLWLQPFTWRIKPIFAGIAVYVLLIAAAAVIPAGAYALITGAFRRRPAAWESDPAGRRFSAPSSPRQATLTILSAWVVARCVPVERVPNLDRARIAHLGAFTTIFIVIAVALLIDIALRSMTNGPSLVLSPDGLTLRRRVRQDQIGWDTLLPGGPRRPAKRNPATIQLRRHRTAPDRPTGRLSLPAVGLLIDPAFLAYTIRWYVEHPERRARIGDAAELAELQRRFAGDGHQQG
ncbi:hypothetical protein [Actinoplanes sp. NPDC026619]|uniref:hypothetical protein n=1 Tax=Actinoplanes sp. NPDC026619 TaxID=3155798 RepID=UPI0033D07E64